jgi:nucleoside phosphorylase
LKSIEEMVKLSPEDYTVAWLCALPSTDLVAATCMLDQNHQPLPQPVDDENLYFYGAINGHNVVISSLPVGLIGKVSTTIQVQSLLRSFKELKICLFVGTGGGVPYQPPKEDPKGDIHLGDVVVGWPENAKAPAVIQYDFKRNQQNGEDDLLSRSENPNRLLLNTLGAIISNHVMGETKFAEHLKKVSHLAGFTHQGIENDMLYEASYVHDHNQPNCSKCDQSAIVKRKPRSDTTLAFHQSTILSGDTVIKNAQDRDRLSKQYWNARCFEMEASGTVGSNCLVIRGISNYCDSHKNDSWTSYAAATAASFARELLYTIPSSDPKNRAREHQIIVPAEEIRWRLLPNQEVADQVTNKVNDWRMHVPEIPN